MTARTETPGRILIVDDDPDILDSLALVLESAGYLTDTAMNGAEALKRLGAAPTPGLILLDLMMPVMDGWGFRKEQLRDPALASIPVVIMTGFGGAPEKAASIRAAGCLNKPIELEALLTKVKTLYEKPKPTNGKAT